MRKEEDKEKGKMIVNYIFENNLIKVKESIYHNMLRKIRDVLILRKSKVGNKIVRKGRNNES